MTNKYSVAAILLSLMALIFEFISSMSSEKAMEQEIEEEVAKKVEEVLRNRSVVNINSQNKRPKR